MRKEIAEIFKEFRQYLCNTEFAPPPFDDTPFDPKMINEVFPGQILSLLIEKIKKSLLTDAEVLVAGANLPHLIKGNIAHHRVVVGKLVAQAQLDKVLKIVEEK